MRRALAGGEHRAQAIAWLRADLVLRRAQVDSGPALVERKMAHWKKDVDLVSIRDAEDLSDDGKAFWVDVDTVLDRARARANELSK